MKAGNVEFSMASWPLIVPLPVSYEATDPPLPIEEDEEGNIIPSAALDDPWEEFEPGDDAGEAGAEEDT